MTGPGQDEFDDVALKRAVRRACAGQTAPPALRRRVETLLSAGTVVAAAASSGPPASRLRWPGWTGSAPWKTLAAAAACLAALVLAGVQIWSTFAPQRAFEPPPRIAFPASVTAQLIAAHDNCAKAPDASLVTGADPTAVLQQLAQGQIPDTSGSISIPSGWQFKGGNLCTVGDTKAAHLLFARGKDTISVFSMGAPRDCKRGSSNLFRDVVDGHAVEGFIYSGSVYGVVGTNGSGGAVALSDLDKLTTQVGECVGANGCEGLGASHAAESTRPIAQ